MGSHQSDEQFHEKDVPVAVVRGNADLHQLLQHSPLPNIALDAKGRIVAANTLWQRMMGVEHETVNGKDFAAFLAPESRALFWAHFTSAAKLDEIPELLLTLVRKDGTSVQIRHFSRTTGGDSSRIIFTGCQEQDPPPLPQADAPKSLDNSRYQMLLEHQGDLLLAFTPDGTLTFVSPSYCKTFAVAAENILGTTFAPKAYPGDTERVQESLASITPEAPTTYHEQRLFTAKGWRWYDWAAHGVFDAHDQLVEIISVGRDCTERKQMESALDDLLLELEHRVEKRTAQLEEANNLLRQEIAERARASARLAASERKYRALNQNMRDGFAALTLDGRIISYNTAFRDLVGYDDKDLENLKCEEITPWQWIEQERGIINRQVLVRGYSDLYEKEYRRKDDSIVPVELRTHVTLDEEGVPVGMWSIVRDISQRKAQEVAMQEAKRQAEAASQAKSAFLSKMSHEFRTPLNAIINMSELALDTKLDQEQIEYIQAVAASGKRLLQAVNNVLEYASFEEGNIEFRKVTFNLLEVLRSIVKAFHPHAASKGLFLELAFAPALSRHFQGDPQWLYHILASLVDNAVKYTQRGGIRITVSCMAGICPVELDTEDTATRGEHAPQEQQTVTLRIEVGDTGPGMTEKQLENLFTPFLQGEESVNNHYGGSGIGLAMARRVLTLMGGNLRCKSVGGVGSRFIIDLPMQHGVKEAAEPFEKQETERMTLSPMRGKVLNTESALQRFGGDAVLYYEISTEFIAGVGDQLQRLQEFAASGDFQALSLLVQSVRGNCGTIGAEQCCKLAMDIEESAYNKDGDAVIKLVTELAQGIDLVRQTLEEKRKEVAKG